MVLIFNGSPRKEGDTARCVAFLQQSLKGKSTVVEAYHENVSACTDCRYCWQRDGCAIQDGWQRIDILLRSADAVVLAAPIYFSELPGPMLSLLSRIQQYWCARHFRKTELLPNTGKRGGILLLGGGDGRPGKAAETAQTLLHTMNIREIAPPLVFHDTNHAAPLDSPSFQTQLRALAAFLEPIQPPEEDAKND